jgi:lipopolysaccharide/colanic/teichoic acid biosynthesis glycosyltransferase
MTFSRYRSRWAFRLAMTVKRAIDLVGAAIGLVLMAVPMAVIAGAIRATMGSPVLFRQRRAGRDGQPFTIVKFRTMSEGRIGSEGGPEDGVRLTRLGRFLRRTSLDELPELVNVLRGEMSLVGPRPLLLDYLELYTPEQAERHEVRPGLTGWAQVNGRNALTWKTKFEHDTWYVRNWTLGLDLKILLTTLIVVIQGRGVTQPGRATVDRFRGNREEESESVKKVAGEST